MDGFQGPSWLDRARLHPLGAGLVMLITGYQYILCTRHLTQLFFQPPWGGIFYSSHDTQQEPEASRLR